MEATKPSTPNLRTPATPLPAPQHLGLMTHPDGHLKMMFSRSNGYSMMPVVGTRTRSTSCWVGR